MTLFYQSEQTFDMGVHHSESTERIMKFSQIVDVGPAGSHRTTNDPRRDLFALRTDVARVVGVTEIAQGREPLPATSIDLEKDPTVTALLTMIEVGKNLLPITL